MKKFYFKVYVLFLLSLIISHFVKAQYLMEKLDRGVVAVSMGGNKVFISWRWLGTEESNVTFNLYRNGTKVNSNPLTACNYTDNSGSTTSSYTVRAIINNVEQPASAPVTPWAQQYLKIPVQAPAGGTSKDGVAYTYNANDASIADLDGDGQFEIILKWDPSNSKDNSQSGYTGNTYVDAYKLNGQRMWRIDFGVNIRSGAHYMDFMVYDFDCDGKAEMMCKTGDGTIDGKGTVIGNASADYRNSSGYVLSGPEYISVFNGQTGAVMATSNYIPARGTVASWGDNYGNRVDRFRAGVAYLDGKKPSGIFCRGYYTRAVVAAWDWQSGKLTNRWTFDSNNSGNTSYAGQGDHSLSIADVDDDGKQEVVVGSAIIDDNGAGYYNTSYGHGDALHVSDLDPDLPGIEVFNIQERVDQQGAYMYNAKTKKVLWTKPTASGSDEGPGRGVSADISAAFKGAESWVAGGGVSGVFNCKGDVTGLAAPVSCNFLAWWDGDLLRELLNNTMIDKYGTGRLLTAYNIAPIASNNGSKSTPSLSGDIIGDWREEVLWRGSANDALYLFTTNIATDYKFRTFLHDPQYRVALAWQNTGYNQPPHLSYYLGDGMTAPTKPNIAIIGESTNSLPSIQITSPETGAIFTEPATVTISANATDIDGLVTKVEFYNGTTKLGEDITGPYSFTWNNVSSGTYTITAIAIDDKAGQSVSTPITVVVNPRPSDCNGTPGGSATLDNCGRCVGGTTGKMACTSMIQAENACEFDGVTETTNAGFLGASYVNGPNETGSEILFSVNSQTAQTILMSVRYANGVAASRDMQVVVNGQNGPTISVGGTGAWTTWTTADAQVVLKQGPNIISFVALTANGNPNIDLISFTNSGISGGSCTKDCNGDIGGSASTDLCGVCTGGNTGKTTMDSDKDNQPDCVDNDDDNDGVQDTEDCAPLNAAIKGKLTYYEDTDGDGFGTGTGISSCTVPSGAYVTKAGDECPSDKNKIAPGNCGCGKSEESCKDCAGTPNGNAYLDNCNKCIVPGTDIEPCIEDCNHEWGGEAKPDACGVCAGGKTGIVPVVDPEKCVITSTTTSIQVKEVSVYPNPFESSIRIETQGVFHLRIFNLQGIMVEEKHSENFVEAGSSLESGMYILEIQSGTKMHRIKVTHY